MNAKMLLIHYPYGLRIVCVKSLSEDFIITKLNEHDYEAKSRWDKYVTVPYDSEEYKIVLHPLSHLTKPLKVKDVIVKASDLICKIIAESMHLSLEKVRILRGLSKRLPVTLKILQVVSFRMKLCVGFITFC